MENIQTHFYSIVDLYFANAIEVIVHATIEALIALQSKYTLNPVGQGFTSNN